VVAAAVPLLSVEVEPPEPPVVADEGVLPALPPPPDEPLPAAIAGAAATSPSASA
jgi:hypothetical protein